MLDTNSLIALPLEEAISQLEGYDIELVETNANTVLNKPIDKSKYTMARVIRAVLEGKRAVLLYDYFKEI